VRSRRFALVNRVDSPPRPRWRDAGRSLHVVTDPAEREALRQDQRFVASPHHGDRGWLALRLDAAGVDWGEVAELLEAAYRHVAGRRLVERLDGGEGAQAASDRPAAPSPAPSPAPVTRPGRRAARRQP
jgi:predicted DNA-binding protein (MmcQ/YjbR family)